MHQAAIDLARRGRRQFEVGTAPAHIENLMKGRTREELHFTDQRELAKLLNVYSYDVTELDRALDRVGYVPEQKQ